MATLGFVGVTPIDTNAAAVTVRVAEPDMEPSVALIVVAPTPLDLASPLEPEALLTEAIAEWVDCQVTVEVRSRLEPSVKRTVAVNC